MKKIITILTGFIIGTLQYLSIGQETETPIIPAGTYSVSVTTPGSFGQVMLQTVENWSEVLDLTVSGHLNATDMGYFSRMQNLKKLNLRQTDITAISGCEGLKYLEEVILPETVETVDDNAFNGCNALSTINISKVTKIGNYSFYNCKNFRTVDFPYVKEVGQSAFSGAFASEQDFISVSMPNAQKIGSHAFSQCNSLISIDIPSCIYLGSSCFSYSFLLTTVTLSDELEYIPDSAFFCTALQSLKLPTKLKIIESYAFEDTGLSFIDIPEGAVQIERCAFSRCPLQYISLPSTLTYIDISAFEYISTLKDVYCKSIVPIKTSAFNNNIAKGATLHVPSLSVVAYKLDENWGLFDKIEALDGDLTDITINSTFDIIDYKGLATNPNFTLTSTTNGEAAHLTISGSSPLSIGKYIQRQNFISQNNGYYDENDNYVYAYTYPYCTTLITNNETRANEVVTAIELPTKAWSFISFPYDVNLSDIVVPEGVMWVVRRYNGANRASMNGETWEDMTSGQILNAGEGYILHCIEIEESGNSWETKYVEFMFPAINNANKNAIFTQNDVQRTINEYPAELPHNRGWNLIGNPFPCFMDSKHIDFAAPITVWNGGGYTAYSLADDYYILHPNEAFFVQCPVGSNTFTFRKEGRTHDYAESNAYYRMPANTNSKESRTILNFILSGDSYSDRARLVLNESATYDYEIERDASKFMSSNGDVPQIYLIDNGINYAIDERPIGDGEFKVGVRTGKEGTYNITLNSTISGHEILLTDKETKQTVDLTKETYSFITAAHTSNDRFTVKIISRGTPNSIENITEAPMGFSINGSYLTIENDNQVAIHTIDGKQVYQGSKRGRIELQSGIYLVSVHGTIHKIIIK